MLRGRGWGYLFPGLAVLGGLHLCFHFRGGAFRLDRICLQHVATALASLAVGMRVFFARRTEGGQALPARARLILVLLLSLVLLFYAET